MNRKYSPDNTKNMRLPMTVNYEKFTPFKPIPPAPSSCSSSLLLPISHPIPIIHKPARKSTGGIPLPILTFLSVAAMLGLVVYTKSQYYTRMQYRSIEERIRDEREHWEYDKEQELEEEKRNNKHLVEEIQTFSRQITNQQQQVITYKTKIQIANDRYLELQQEATISTETLRHAIQTVYRRNAIKEFGQGPHYIEFEIDFHDSSNRQFFTVQLSSLDDMPVSVYTFLQQTSMGLWDNTGFFINAPHVLMAKSQSFDMQTSHYDALAEAGVNSLPFEEYSHRYPHFKYTLGFAGHAPVGPDWYVNVRDNSKNHGPQGLFQSGGEPRFAEIIIGTDVVDRITSIPGEDVVLKAPILIVSARIKKDLKSVVGGAEYLEKQQVQ